MLNEGISTSGSMIYVVLAVVVVFIAVNGVKIFKRIYNRKH